jgi:hypothetical protein
MESADLFTPGPPDASAGYYYGIPNALWDALAREFVEFGRGSPVLPAERGMAKACGDFSRQVGSLIQQAVKYDLLVPKPAFPPLIMPEGLRGTPGWEAMTDQRLEMILQTGDKRIEWINRGRRGYCGWLLTNKDFLSEHDHLFRTHAAVILRHGTSIGSLPSAAATEPTTVLADVQDADESQVAFAKAMKAFCGRWLLSEMAGPYLPSPFGAFAPVASTKQLSSTMLGSGILIYLPYTYAIPTEDELRSLVADALNANATHPHVADWFGVISSGAQNKGIQMQRYGRIFELQHYRRLLQERYPQVMHRSKQKLIQAFAHHFGQSDDTIKNDLRLIEAAAIENPMRTWDLQ